MRPARGALRPPVVACALLLALTACGARPLPTPPVVSPTPVAESMEIILFFPRRDGQGLLRETRTVTRAGEQPELLILAEFLAGPRSPEGRPAFPSLTSRDYGLKLFEDGASVWLPVPVLKQASDKGDGLAVRALVETLCQSPRVKTLRFVIPPDAPTRIGDVDISAPLAPREPASPPPRP